MMRDVVSRKKDPIPPAPERKGGERSEPLRSSGAVPTPSGEGSQAAAIRAVTVGPEVLEKPVRRTFGAEYKRAVLKEADLCQPGELASLLRREGLYSSHLTTWRLQREKGEIGGLAPKKRGRKPAVPTPLSREVDRLRRENENLQRRLAQAELVIEVQKKSLGSWGSP